MTARLQSNLPEVIGRVEAIRASLARMQAQAARPTAEPRFAQVLTEALQATGATHSLPGGFDAIIRDAAERFGLSTDLVHAVVRAESDYDPDCVSSAGAMGLMQLMPGTARALGVIDAYDPVQNVMGGCRYLREQLDRFGDLSLALAAYNAGPGAVSRYGGIPPYRETQTYVRRVLDYMAERTGGTQ